MSKVFVSHSSKDKAFVTRLSHDLLKNKIPVWLDSYELSIGDSLYDKIFSGLDDSNFVIIVISDNYNKTIWTSKEFKAIMSKEDRDGKKYLIPIKIDDTAIPLQIEDRLYQNFHSNYDSSIKQLIRFFKREDLTIEDIPISDRQVILTFKTFIDIDVDIIRAVLVDIALHPEYNFHKKQIFFTEYNKIDTLLSIGKNNVSSISNNAKILKQFEEHNHFIEEYLDKLTKGVLKILNEYKDQKNDFLLSTSIYWFVRAMMCEVYSMILPYLNREQAEAHGLDFDNDLSLPFSNNFCKFYKESSSCQVDVMDNDNGDYFSPYLNGDFSAYQELKGYPLHLTFWQAFDSVSLTKYFIPQNVFYHVMNERTTPLLTNFKKYSVGLH